MGAAAGGLVGLLLRPASPAASSSRRGRITRAFNAIPVLPAREHPARPARSRAGQPQGPQGGGQGRPPGPGHGRAPGRGHPGEAGQLTGHRPIGRLPSGGMNLEGALAYLDAHVNLETVGEPPGSSPAARSHAATWSASWATPSRPTRSSTSPAPTARASTARMITALLVAQGLSVGTYTSPHLERVNERMAWNGEPDRRRRPGRGRSRRWPSWSALLDSPPTHFEILTAAAFRWFADIAVDVAVVEVGLGGRWDATNVADGQVAVVTNVGLDHAEFIGPTLADIAEEKAGIVKPGSTLVLGETDPELAAIFDGRPRPAPRRVAAGPRLRRAPPTTWPSAAAPSTCARPAAATRACSSRSTAPTRATTRPSPWPPPRPSSARRSTPTWSADALADGPAARAGSRSSAATRSSSSTAPTTRPGAAPLDRRLDEAFAAGGGRILVVGHAAAAATRPRCCEAFDAGPARLVVACPPPSPRALPAAEVAAAARRSGYRDRARRASVPEAVATGPRRGRRPTSWCWSPAPSTSSARPGPPSPARR